MASCAVVRCRSDPTPAVGNDEKVRQMTSVTRTEAQCCGETLTDLVFEAPSGLCHTSNLKVRVFVVPTRLWRCGRCQREIVEGFVVQGWVTALADLVGQLRREWAEAGHPWGSPADEAFADTGLTREEALVIRAKARAKYERRKKAASEKP